MIVGTAVSSTQQSFILRTGRGSLLLQVLKKLKHNLLLGGSCGRTMILYCQVPPAARNFMTLRISGGLARWLLLGSSAPPHGLRISPSLRPWERGSVICLAYFTGSAHGKHAAESLL